MLKEILSITGKPGLYKLVSNGKNMLIVESLIDGKRIPAYTKDKAVSLGDIAIFTDTEEMPLGQVLENIKAKENGAKCSIDPKADNDQLKKYMGEVLPEYDRDRVYPSDIRKLISWYNLLTQVGMVDFLAKEEAEVDTKADKETDLHDKLKKEAKPVNVPKDIKQPKQATRLRNDQLTAVKWGSTIDDNCKNNNTMD